MTKKDIVLGKVELVVGSIFIANIPVFEKSSTGTTFKKHVKVKGFITNDYCSERNGLHIFEFNVIESADNGWCKVGEHTSCLEGYIHNNIIEFHLPNDAKQKQKEKNERGREARHKVKMRCHQTMPRKSDLW